jgi:hydroxypyruvate isomerase
VVGLEGWASGDPEVALQRFREAFTVRPGTSPTT